MPQAQRAGDTAQEPAPPAVGDEARRRRAVPVIEEGASVLERRIDQASLRPRALRDARQGFRIDRSDGGGLGVGGGDDTHLRGRLTRRPHHRGQKLEGLVLAAQPAQSDLQVVDAAGRGARGREREGTGQIRSVAQRGAHAGETRPGTGRPPRPRFGVTQAHDGAQGGGRAGSEGSFARVLQIEDIGPLAQGQRGLLGAEDARQEER
ncbi:MAG: hypothetical protein AUI52_01440 [Acidobacteria bacterium 13_1_40CM_2_68_10]|nr:MAG: hypothetical protein AUI52_01440 [Acidobacteria bacterium 13_1_40CM_2_68_10]OLE65923.1 MAG: hypothetical protein AUG03_02565 [Acidobacteria bacterium 13_1_20CM_2_68_14]